jgi:CCR4-NOT transcription complex subunit 1
MYPNLVVTLRRALATADAAPNNWDARAPVRERVVDPFTAVRPDPLALDIEEPPEEVKDKILFVVNNLAPDNKEKKLADMRELWDDRYARWFAHYLVHLRIGQEPNNHQLYMEFLDALNNRAMSRYIIQESIAKSAAMLNADSTVASQMDRRVLWNMADWLGKITLARDKPILHRNLSFKDLLLEAADSSRLGIAIPFICHLLKQTAPSVVFKAPNPWLMGVLGLLVELYHFADIKLQMKFEIETLFQDIGLALDEVEATAQFRDRPIAAEPVMPEFNGLENMPLNEYGSGAALGAEAQVMPIQAGSPGESQRAMSAHIEAIMSSLSHMVVINPEFGVNPNPSLKRAVQVGVDRAVREVRGFAHME